MKIKWNLIIALIFTISSCSKNEANFPATANNVLLLKVDFTTNTFEGGKEFSFPDTSSSMTITYEYVVPADIGSLKFTYLELNETLFDGSVIWSGLGKIYFPQDIVPANKFKSSSATDVLYPGAGFQNVFNPGNNTYDYTPVWLAIQRLEKVRAYLNSNPNAPVNIFLYTPSVGIGDPKDWDWIIFMKN